MKLVQPKEFIIKLNQCGVDTCKGNYAVMKDKDALNLSLLVNHTMIKDFINKDHRQLFRYQLACKLLKEVLKENFNIRDIEQDIKNADKFMDKWKLREQPKEEKK